MTHSFALLAEAKPQDNAADSWINEVIKPLRAEAVAFDHDLMGNERENIIADYHTKLVMRATWVVLAVIVFGAVVSS